MGSLKIKLDCRVDGPLSNGEAEKAALEWAEATARRLGDEGVDLLKAFPMNKTGRARGGFQSELKAVSTSPTRVVIRGPQDRGVVWSSWLEGTSTRNSSTGFKGYHLFRKTRLQLDKMAPGVGQEELEKYLPRMGGE